MSEIWNLSALCRCCHADGEFKSLQMPYCHGGTVEVYSNMLRECLGISIVPPPIEASYSICESCIHKLREANAFRKQVLDCEQKFIIYCQNETAVNHADVIIKSEPVIPDEQESQYANSVEVAIKSIDKCLKSPKDCKEEADDFEPWDDRGNDSDEDDKNDVKSESKKEIKLEESEKKPVKKGVKNTSKKVIQREKQSEKKVVKKRGKKTSQNVIQTEKRNTFLCAVCPEARFTDEEILNSHIETTHTSPINCQICSVEFKNYKKYKAHLAKCNPRRFKCNYCERVYTSGYVLIEHENWAHTKVNLFKCDICQKEFSSKAVLRRHILYHEGRQKKCKCDLCGQLFNDRSNMKIHIETVHQRIRKFSCHICHQRFTLKKHLKSHLEKHSAEGQVDCKIDNKKYYLTHSRTVKVHDKNYKKVYKCKVCDSKFDGRGPYIRHIREHSSRGLLPYTCEICGRNFAMRFTLNRHILCHLDAERMKFPCEICGKKYTAKATMLRHMKNFHNPENQLIKKVRCTLCNSHVKDLERHQKKHNIRPYACVICQKTYPQRNALNRHVKLTHLGVKLHCCQHCNKEYTRADVLRKHMLRAHKNLLNTSVNVKVEPEQAEQNIPVYNIEFTS